MADALYSFAGMLGSSEFFAPFKDSAALTSDKAIVVLSILGAFASLAGAVCFFRRASYKPAKPLDVAFGLFVILRMISGVFIVYFDMEVPMNSPHKLIIQWALITSMLFILHEGRFFAPVAKRPRAYLGYGFAAMMLTASAGIGGLFSYFSGLLEEGRFCVESLICLMLFVYISASIHSYVKQFCAAEPAETAEFTESVDPVE